MDARLDLYADEPYFEKKFDFKKHGVIELDSKLEENVTISDIAKKED